MRGGCCENWRGEELHPGDLPLHSGDCPLAAAPAPAGGLLERIEELEEFSRDAGVGAEERGPSLLKELCAAGTVGVAIAHAARRLRECAGLPPREGL
jgi:hypothetical protein